MRVTRPAVNSAPVTPSALNAAALTAAKSAGGVATCLRIAAQSRFCQAARNAFSVACGVEDEPPHADRPDGGRERQRGDGQPGHQPQPHAGEDTRLRGTLLARRDAALDE